MDKYIPWSPKRIIQHWKEDKEWIYYFAFSLPFYRNWSGCECVKERMKSPTFLKELPTVFHCWECAIAIIFLRIFIFPFIPKTKHYFGYYKGFWDNTKTESVT